MAWIGIVVLILSQGNIQGEGDESRRPKSVGHPSKRNAVTVLLTSPDSIQPIHATGGWLI